MAISIEVRNNRMYAVDAVVNAGKVTIKKAFTMELPEGIVDSKGILDPIQFGRILESGLSEHHLKAKKISACINNPSVIYRELVIPRVDDKKMSFVVRSEMISSLNLTNEYIIDYLILDEFLDQRKPFYRILAVAILDSAMKSFVDTFKHIKIIPTVVETSTSSIIKYVDLAGISNDGDPIIVADIEDNALKLYLFEENKYVLTRNTKISEEMADRSSLIGVIEDNINKMVQFQYTRPSHQGVKRIYLFGKEGLVEQAMSSIRESLQIDTQIFPQTNFVIDETGTPHYIKLYAVGALLRK